MKLKMKKKNVASLLGTVLLMSVTASAMAAESKPQQQPLTSAVKVSISAVPSSLVKTDTMITDKTTNYVALESTVVASTQMDFKVNSTTKDGIEVFRVNEDKLQNGGTARVEVTSGVVSREDLEGVLKDLKWTVEKKETTLKNYDQNMVIQNQLETLYRSLENAGEDEVKQTLEKAQQLQAKTTDIFEAELLKALVSKGILVKNENEVQIMSMNKAVQIDSIK